MQKRRRVSPGFTSRPSLSATPERSHGVSRDFSSKVSPGFTSRPSLSVSRSRLRGSRVGQRCVAGIHVPAFVERAGAGSSSEHRQVHVVSPGFTSRPSLSALARAREQSRTGRKVSPGFTSRPSLSGVHTRITVGRRRLPVSPGFTSRPSLSAGHGIGRYKRVVPTLGVSPGFTSRPSLSEGTSKGHQWPLPGSRVAGIHVPAFVERSRGSSALDTKAGAPERVAGIHVPAFVERLGCRGAWLRLAALPCVAGIHVPAFVERFNGPGSATAYKWDLVSPGFTSRPSLSVPRMRRNS